MVVADTHLLLSEMGVGAGSSELMQKPFLLPASLGCATWAPCDLMVPVASAAAPSVCEVLRSARCSSAPHVSSTVSFNHSVRNMVIFILQIRTLGLGEADQPGWRCWLELKSQGGDRSSSDS